MTFVFPALLGGLALIGIPVLIHLIMRQKPKVIPFPAFRFLVKRHKRNLRKLQLRHFLLLALRIILIAAVCLALARPKLFSEALKLGGDRPVAAVLVIDTGPLMEYKVPRDQDNPTRLDDAKRRANELLDRLPAGSRVAVLDSGEPTQGGKGEWHTSMQQASKRIDGLRIRYGRNSVTDRLEDAYRLLNDLARGKDDGKGLARLVCVVSDRSGASWESGRLAKLQEERDQIPPPFERLSSSREQIPGVIERLRDLRKRIPPPPGQDYPEQAVIDLLEKARDRLGAVTDEDYPQTDLASFLTTVRASVRGLLGAVEGQRERVPTEAKEYHGELVKTLRQFLHELRGAHELYVDVGVDNPADGAVLDLETPRLGRQNLPRQEFADETFIVRAVVHATGKDLENALVLRLGERKEQQAVTVRAGEKKSYSFTVDSSKLPPGPHQLQVSLANPDLMPFNNARHFTFAVSEPRKILIVTDEPDRARDLKSALEKLRLARLRSFRETVLPAKQVAVEGRDYLDRYRAVYLMNVARPSKELWTLLEAYVRKGGGVGVILGPETDKEAYDSAEARKLLPARPQRIETIESDKRAKDGVWDWDTMAFQHPLMAPFREWKGNRGIDFVAVSPSVTRFWRVEPEGKDAVVLVRYGGANGAPALVTRQLEGGGRVLLFSTTMELREREAAWNDYPSSLTSFFVILTDLSTTYLAGEAEPVRLNFISGQDEPSLRLPLDRRLIAYTLWRGGDLVGTVSADPQRNELRFPQAAAPGNFTVEGEGKRIGAFSVNVAPEQSLLTRVPVGEVEALLGPDAVASAGVKTDLQEALSGHWSQPVELLPTLLLLVLIALAVENLLSNKFYRREQQPPA